MAKTSRNQDFAAYVEKLAAGRSNRELARATEEAGSRVNATSIGDMRWGTVPTYKLLEKFANGLELDAERRSELFRVAGYATVAAGTPEPNAVVRQIMTSADELHYEPDLEAIDVAGFQGAENLTEKDKATINRIVRAILSEKRRSEGRE